MSDTTSTAAPDRPTTRMIRKVTAAGAIGTTVEYYDYFIYGTAAALVLNRLFFPDFDPVIGTLAAFATFAVGFLARPFGGVVFGHFGDKHGRKAMLIVSLSLMGVATFCMGLLPTYREIGLGAPALLVLLRLCQGFAVGGEWGGASVLATEYSRPHNRGFIGSVVQIGSPAGLLLSTGAFALVSQLPDDALYGWGWRVPFLASAVLVGIGLWIRLSILESPEFQRAKTAAHSVKEHRRPPVVDLFRLHWRPLLVAMGARFAPDIGFYVVGTFIVSYGASEIGYSTSTILAAISVAAGIEVLTVPMFGRLSDRIGRRRTYMMGSLFWVVFAFPFFWLVNSGTTPMLWTGILISFVLGHASMWAVAASFYAELFPTLVRTTGAGLGLNLSIVFGGGPAPFVAAALVAWAGHSSWPVSVYLTLAGAISFVAVLLSRETAHRDLSVDERLVGVDVMAEPASTAAEGAADTAQPAEAAPTAMAEDDAVRP